MTELISRLTVYFLYTMSSVPFIVWAGRSAYSGTVASKAPRPWPGITSTISRVLLPLTLIFLYAWNASVSSRPGAADASEWMPFQFLLLPPALGSIAGYGIGYFMGKRRII
ncbi:hypothetical protein LJR231_000504 [Phyllobacterium sp. LjRoot231]|uniref:hypothetical protein n=1 Tax=Phyllobacterium sp. LjRoot231 TaxID=3342289 RepID=UPI003ECE211B